MAAMQSFQIHPSTLKHQRFPHATRNKLSPNTCCPLFSFVSKATILSGPRGNGVLVNCLPPVDNHADEDLGSVPPDLWKDSMPIHVAVIMDGNRRWAQMRGLPSVSGYEAGAHAFRTVVDLCCKWRITVLTVFVFSSDNWTRPKVEIDFIMELLERALRDELQQLMRKNVRVSLIGDSTRLPKPLQVLLREAEETTKNNSQLHLIFALNYSGQNDILQACQNMALKVKDGHIEPEDINKFLLEKELETNCTEFPNPDLLIRTSGELRISNFFLWQLAYTKLYFANSLWPDFGEDEFVEALSSFQQRQRRYGGRSGS
ncbi:cis-prenyltransferase 4, chloroplastic-like isoform X2 [Primulina huaijiensis]|uniref:cis-prenyltransferase 4, chloroplastic-like isoform X2 n=1 Tax=Primulina huaijiensis TaxID=1492673 RepID=UPI003CC70D70